MPRVIDKVEMNLVGGKVRQLRLERGWSQQYISDKLELMAIYVCRAAISRIEERTRTVTDLELYGLAQVFGVSMEDLIEIS